MHNLEGRLRCTLKEAMVYHHLCNSLSMHVFYKGKGIAVSTSVLMCGLAI